MEKLKEHDMVLVKLGIRDLAKLPIQTEIITRDLLIYDLYFSLEQLVEEGWQNNLRAVNVRSSETRDGRDPKKRKE